MTVHKVAALRANAKAALERAVTAAGKAQAHAECALGKMARPENHTLGAVGNEALDAKDLAIDALSNLAVALEAIDALHGLQDDLGERGTESVGGVLARLKAKHADAAPPPAPHDDKIVPFTPKRAAGPQPTPPEPPRAA